MVLYPNNNYYIIKPSADGQRIKGTLDGFESILKKINKIAE